MNDLRCHKMDLLGNRLIEAYRGLSDVEMLAGEADDNWKAKKEMVTVQYEIANHRQDCFLCRTVQTRQEAMKAFAVDEPVWRGTMAS